ncbi:MAG: ATP-binding protein [Nocardioidaceae bacterium]
MTRHFDRSSRLIGRADELRVLHDLIGADPDRANSAAIVLGGEAGVGKTRTLVEFGQLAQKRGWRVLVGHCLDFGDSALSYLPFTEMLGRLAVESSAVAASLVEESPALSRLMPGRRLLPDPEQKPTEPMARADLFEAIHAALEQLGSAEPVLVVIEDVHWADQSTREVLSFLFARRFSTPVSIVASYRSDDLHRRHPLLATLAEWTRMPGVSRVELPRLADADVREIVRAIHPTPIRESEMQAIVLRAEGNAFFAEELADATATNASGLPTDLSHLLLVRLDQLDDAAKTVVRAASVAGRRVSHTLLSHVVELDPAVLDVALRSAVESNILVPAGADGYAARHALLAEAVYDDLLPGERARLHAAYAAALRGHDIPGTAAELARHARAAHDIPTAVRAGIEAGDDAMSVGGPDEAARHYVQALELVAGPYADVTASTDDSAPIDAVELAVKASEAMAAGRPAAPCGSPDSRSDQPAANDSPLSRTSHVVVSARHRGTARRHKRRPARGDDRGAQGRPRRTPDGTSRSTARRARARQYGPPA